MICVCCKEEKDTLLDFCNSSRRIESSFFNQCKRCCAIKTLEYRRGYMSPEYVRRVREFYGIDDVATSLL